MKTKLKIMIPAAIALIAVVIAVFCIRFTPADKAEDISALISTAQKYLIGNNYEQAIVEFEKILELDPMNVNAYLGLAEAYRDNGNLDKAVEILEKGVELTGDGRLKAQIEDLQKILNTKIPAEAVVYNGHSYYVYSDICETWEEAQEYCVSLGGYLAVINDDSENTAVYNILRSFGYKNAYFGYSDKEEDGNWLWVNDSSNYANWNEYEPSDGFYAMYYWKWEYTWNDGTFDDQTDEGGQEFICEWDIEGEGCKKFDELDMLYTDVTSDTETETVIDTTAEEVRYVTVGEYSIPTDITSLSIVGPNSNEDTLYNITTNEEAYTYKLNEPLTDISFISEFKNLIFLKLCCNEIFDLEPLRGLTGLTSLTLHGNRVSDIEPLSELTNLTFLDISVNQISDISSLKMLTNLTSLQLYRNQISDISSLSGLTNLTFLSLTANQIGDISPLSGLINLTSLDLAYNQKIGDITPLSNLNNLIFLQLGDNQISDINSLKKLTNLTSLQLYGNPIKQEDIENLKQSLPNCNIKYY